MELVIFGKMLVKIIIQALIIDKNRINNSEFADQMERTRMNVYIFKIL